MSQRLHPNQGQGLSSTARDLLLLTDSVGDVFWLFSPDRKKLLHFSPAFARVWGRSPDAFYDNPLALVETIHPDDRHLVETDLAEQQFGNFAAEYSQEYRILRPDGAVRWIWTRYIPVRDRTGAVDRIAGISTDITSRKLIEQQLAQSQQKLEKQVAERTRELEAANHKLCVELAERRKVEESLQQHERAIAASPVAIVMVDQAGQLTSVNAAFLRIWRYDSAVHVLGRHVRDFFGDSTALPQLLDTLRLGVRQSGELVGVRGDGSRVECEFSSAPVDDAGGARRLYMAWLNDISERKSVERSLAEREAFCSSLADLSLVGIHRADSDGNCTFVNQACCDLAGVKPEAFYGGSWQKFLHPEDRARVLEEWKQVAERHEKYDGVFRCIHADGHTIWVHSQSQPERAPDGNIAGCVGTIMEVTARVLQDQEIRRLNRDLQEKVTELEALFRVIPIGLAIAEDAQCQVIRANPEFSRMLATTENANVSLTRLPAERPRHFDIFHQGRKLTPQELPLQTTARTGRDVRDMELQYVHHDGRALNVLAFTAPLLDNLGEVRGAVGAFLDITARKAAEQTLIDSKQRLRNILNSMYVFVGQFTTDGKVLETNKASLEVAKLRPEDVFGKYLWGIPTGSRTHRRLRRNSGQFSKKSPAGIGYVLIRWCASASRS